MGNVVEFVDADAGVIPARDQEGWWKWSSACLALTSTVIGGSTTFGGEVRSGVWCGVNVACKRVFPLAESWSGLPNLDAALKLQLSVRQCFDVVVTTNPSRRVWCSYITRT